MYFFLILGSPQLSGPATKKKPFIGYSNHSLFCKKKNVLKNYYLLINYTNEYKVMT